MEKTGEFYHSYLHDIPKISNKKCLNLRKCKKENVGTCDKSNAKTEKLRKLSVIQKYRSAYLKRYVYAKGVKYCRRRPKKTFVIPVFHVKRKPDNPFNVKNIVDNLRKQLTGPLQKISEDNQHWFIDTEACHSGIEEKIRKTRNWESIRYKYQLDYKEKLKMEREKLLKEYAEKRKMANKQQRAENIRTFYQTMEEPTKYNSEIPRNAGITNQQLVRISAERNLRYKTMELRQASESEEFFKTSTERQPQTSSTSGTLNISEGSIKYYHTDDGNNNCESVDLTKDYEPSILVPRSEVQQMSFIRNDGGALKRGHIQRETKRHEILNHSEPLPRNFQLQNEIPKKSRRTDYDFSIPFNESNILIKVMTPEGKQPTNLTNQTNTLLQETLQYATEMKEKTNTPKRVSSDQDLKPDTTRSDHGPESKWIQYIQNILSRSCDPKPECVNKKTTVSQSRSIAKPAETTQFINHFKEPPSKEYSDHISLTNTTSTQQPSVTRVNTTAVSTTSTSNFYDQSSSGRIKQDKPLIPNPRVVRPKVLHPGPYFRSDSLRNNAQFSEHLDDPSGVALTVPQYPSAPQIPDHSPIPHHLEYIYSSHPTNYHPEFNMVRRRIPFDISHANLMGQPIFSPYDPAFLQYRNDMERISQPSLDPYIQHNMHVPLNPNVGFLPPRPTAPGVYRYLNPQHVHPVWVYPHMPER